VVVLVVLPFRRLGLLVHIYVRSKVVGLMIELGDDASTAVSTCYWGRSFHPMAVLIMVEQYRIVGKQLPDHSYIPVQVPYVRTKYFEQSHVKNSTLSYYKNRTTVST
jgi:hypothetical protein